MPFGMSSYDRWLLPKEGSGTYDITCKAPLVYCGCTGEPTNLIERRFLQRPHWFRAVTVCERCGEYEDLDVDECGERYTSDGNWMEGYGISDLEPCPRCGNDVGELADVDEAEPPEPDYEAMMEAKWEDRFDGRDVW